MEQRAAAIRIPVKPNCASSVAARHPSYRNKSLHWSFPLVSSTAKVGQERIKALEQGGTLVLGSHLVQDPRYDLYRLKRCKLSVVDPAQNPPPRSKNTQPRELAKEDPLLLERNRTLVVVSSWSSEPQICLYQNTRRALLLIVASSSSGRGRENRTIAQLREAEKEISTNARARKVLGKGPILFEHIRDRPSSITWWTVLVSQEPESVE